MPYASEHSARLLPPDFPAYRRTNDKFRKGIHAIWGIRQGTVSLQAIRFDASRFTPAEAKKWLTEHDFRPIKFEPSTKQNPSPDYLFYQFHGKPSKGAKAVNMYYPKTLIILGKAYAVEYLSNKWHGGGDGTTAIYRHKFETPAIVCMDERARGQLYIMGNGVKVTDAGIEG
jgi:hypothetical protein